MTILRQKSDFNIDAAELLIKECIYAPSIHCSYYSCFQLLKFIIKEFCGMDYETQAVNISTSSVQTHQYIVNYVTCELRKFIGFEESRKFKRTINDLKQFRVEADYHDIEIDLGQSELALSKAIEIRRYLIAKFNV